MGHSAPLDNWSASCERCVWDLVGLSCAPGSVGCADAQADFSEN